MDGKKTGPNRSHHPLLGKERPQNREEQQHRGHVEGDVGEVVGHGCFTEHTPREIQRDRGQRAIVAVPVEFVDVVEEPAGEDPRSGSSASGTGPPSRIRSRSSHTRSPVMEGTNGMMAAAVKRTGSSRFHTERTPG
jgi:hypothetical protein